MWDDAIKRGMKTQRIVAINRIQAGDYDGKCYAFEFLPEMQRWALQYLDSYVQEKGGSRGMATSSLSEMMDGCALAKAIDEFNYARFTKRNTLEQVRAMPL